MGERSREEARQAAEEAATTLVREAWRPGGLTPWEIRDVLEEAILAEAQARYLRLHGELHAWRVREPAKKD